MASVRALRGALASAVLLTLNPVTLGPASADNWPSRPISTISAVSAGNAGDTIARIVLDQVSKQIGQSFVLENRPGGGTIGTAYVAKGDPDGHTMLLLTSSQ
jgi:tripartite-type tricarboxylate transporter receptor subunit TctC